MNVRLLQSSVGLPCVVQAYPLVHAVQEGSKFALQLGYLVERTAFYSPALWLLRQRIVRVSGSELVRYVDSARCYNQGQYKLR